MNVLDKEKKIQKKPQQGFAYIHAQNEKTNSVGQHNLKLDSKPIVSVPSQPLTTFENIMRQRWIKANLFIPMVDKLDIGKEVPLVNGNLIVPEAQRR